MLPNKLDDGRRVLRQRTFLKTLGRGKASGKSLKGLKQEIKMIIFHAIFGLIVANWIWETYIAHPDGDDYTDGLY